MDQADLKTYNPEASELRKTIEEEIKEKVSKKEYKAVTSSTGTGTGYRYSSYGSTSKKNTKKEEKPMLEDIDVKYVSSFDEVLNDPNYWQDVLGD